MKKKSVAIFSTNTQLLRFFEIEALSLGFDVNKYDMFFDVEDNFDLIVIDSDTTLAFPDAFSSPVCLVSSATKDKDAEAEANNEYSDRYALPWPTPIGLFRSILQKVYLYSEPSVIIDKNHKKDTESIIYYSPKQNNVIWYCNKKIILSDLEMKLLLCLCDAKGETVDRTALNALFETDNGNIADVYVHHLRKKLEDPFSRKLIYTVRSMGYRIDAKIKKI